MNYLNPLRCQLEKVDIKSMGSPLNAVIRITAVGVIDQNDIQLLMDHFKAKRPVEVCEMMEVGGLSITIDFKGRT